MKEGGKRGDAVVAGTPTSNTSEALFCTRCEANKATHHTYQH